LPFPDPTGSLLVASLVDDNAAKGKKLAVPHRYFDGRGAVEQIEL